MSQALRLKVDNELAAALVQLLQLANVKPEDGQITANNIYEAINSLKARMEGGGVPGAMGSAPGPGINQPMPMGGLNEMASFVQAQGSQGKEDLSDETILLVGLLGIVTYQVKMGLAKKGASVTIVKGVDEAIHEFQKRPYTGVLIDINLPTEREGLMVLIEINRFAKEKGLDTNIGILAMPIKERRLDMENICKQHGANGFIEKTEGWHQRAIEFFQGKLPQASTEFPF